MLQDNNYYIMVIIFDKKQYTLPLVTGKNPKFNFDERIYDFDEGEEIVRFDEDNENENDEEDENSII